MSIANREVGLGTIFYAKGLNELISKIRLLRQVVVQLSGGQEALAKSSSKITSAQEKASRAIDKVTDSGQKYNKQIGKIEDGIKRMGMAIKVTAAYSVAAGALFGIVGAAKAGVREIVNFDQALKNLQAISGATNAELAVMEGKMVELASNTRYSATEIGDGMVYIAQAGFSASESMNVIDASAKLATGTLSTLEETSDLLTTTLASFQMESYRAGEAADVMAAAINWSKLTVEKLRTTFNYVGAAGYQVGLSLNEVAASTMILANNGMKASTIGTGLRQVLSRMIAPTGKLKEAFEKYGIKLSDINVKTVGYEKAMTNLSKVIMKQDGVTVDMSKAFELFGLRGAQAVAILAESFTSGKYKKMLASTYEVGTANEMAAKQAEGLGFKVKQLSDKFGALAITIGKGGFTEILRGTITAFQTLLDLLIKIAGTPIGNIIIQFVTLTTAVTALGTSLVLLGKVLQYTIMPSLRAFFALVAAHPIVAGLTAAVAALVIVYKEFSNLAEKRIEKLKEENVETQRLSEVLHFYAGLMGGQVEKMSKTTELQEEHLAVLKRLREDYPELAKVIDSTKKSYEGYLKVLQRVRDLERVKEVENLSGKAEIYKGIKAEYLKFQQEMQDYYQLTGWTSETDPDRERNKKKLEGLKKDTEAAMEELDAAFYNTSIRKGEGASRYGSLMLNAFGLDKETIAKIQPGLIAELNKFEKVIAENKKKSQKEAADEEISFTDTQLKTLLDLRLRSASDETAKIKAAHAKRLHDLATEEKEMLSKSETSTQAQKDEIRKRFNSIRADEEKRFQIELAELEAERIEAEIKKKELLLKAKYQGEMAEAIKLEGNLDAIREAEKQSEIQLAEEIVAIRQSMYDRIKNIFSGGGGEKEVGKAEDALLQAKLDLETKKKEKVEILAKDETDTKKKELAKQLKLQQEYSDEWMKIKEQMHERGEITDTEWYELQRRKVAQQGTWIEQFKFGLLESKKEIQSWGEYVIQMGEQTAAFLADSFSSAVADWISGTKSMKEAFSEMAQDILNWIVKMIVKMLVLKAIEAGVNAIVPGGGTALAAFMKHGGLKSSNVTRSVPAEMFIGAPRLHSGLIRSDEMPAILKKNESVLTPDQMKAMSGQGSINITNSFAGATFLDQEQMRRTMVQVSSITAQTIVKQSGADYLIKAIKNDHPVRAALARGY